MCKTLGNVKLECSLVPRPLSFFCVGVGKERVWWISVCGFVQPRTPFLSLPQHKRKKAVWARDYFVTSCIFSSSIRLRRSVIDTSRNIATELGRLNFCVSFAESFQ